jgi:hypothetical protein
MAMIRRRFLGLVAGVATMLSVSGRALSRPVVLPDDGPLVGKMQKELEREFWRSVGHSPGINVLVDPNVDSPFALVNFGIRSEVPVDHWRHYMAKFGRAAASVIRERCESRPDRTVRLPYSGPKLIASLQDDGRTFDCRFSIVLWTD